MDEEKETPIIEQKEGVKLTKNAKGDMQWEIKVKGSNLASELTNEDIKRLNKINDELEVKYGRKPDKD